MAIKALHGVKILYLLFLFAEQSQGCNTHSPPTSEPLLHAPSWRITEPDD